MAKDNKFGTFGGVFTPSILTILGVIMYLRLPWVVGQAGLVPALAIIGIAHVISVTTGLSISSIATDKRVGAGGPYYIVSRSLGLSIGGALGVALFMGLALSTSLYIIGFCESFLRFIAPYTEELIGYTVTASLEEIRICGTVALVVLTVVTLISTEFAIKTQYIILALIAASLVSIALGNPDAPADPHLRNPGGPVSAATIFGIFFPAVTGFTAGVNMSGDLRDPNKSLPGGTMAAIGVGFVVYVGLAAFLAFRVPVEMLADENVEVFKQIAAFPMAVVLGIWGATLSSALGTVLGAPRILQALSVDRVTPHFLAKGSGETNEPRRALVIAFLIAEAGILIGELNVIAEVVSMVFLTTYGFLNLSFAIEKWASPDFRPTFSVSKWVGIIGAGVSVLVMVFLNLPAMLGAVAFMLLLFVWLKRRQLQLESGDTWEGIWNSIVRAGLDALSRSQAQQRNWRPNIISFSRAPADSRGVMDFGGTLVGGRGILSHFELYKAPKPSKEPPPSEAPPVGLFTHRYPTAEPDDAIRTISEHHGFTGIRPNTVMLPWPDENLESFGETLDSLIALERNVLVLARDATVGYRNQQRVDVWWSPEAGNVSFCLSLIRFLTSARPWHAADVRFLILGGEDASADGLRAETRRLLREARVDAAVRVIISPAADRSFEDWVREESSDADLTLVGLPAVPSKVVDQQGRMIEALGSVLFFRAGPEFEDSLQPSAHALVKPRPPQGEGGAEDSLTIRLTPVNLPEVPEIARAATVFSTRYHRRAKALHDECLAGIYADHLDVVTQLRETVERHFAMLDKGLRSANPRRRRNLVNRVQSSFLHKARELLDDLESRTFPEHKKRLDARLETFGEQDTRLPSGQGGLLRVRRPRADFDPDPKDTPQLRGVKRRRRLFAFGRSELPYDVPVGDLQEHYDDVARRDLLYRAIRRLEADTHQIIVAIGKLVHTSRTTLTLIGDGLTDREDQDAYVKKQEITALERLQGLEKGQRERGDASLGAVLADAHALAQAFAEDIGRIDVRRHLRQARRAYLSGDEWEADLEAAPERWLEHQQLLVGRAQLGLQVSSFQHRLATIANRTKEALALELRSGMLGDCEALRQALVELQEKVDADEEAQLPVGLDFRSSFDVKQIMLGLAREVNAATIDLPDDSITLTDNSIRQFEEGKPADVEVITLPVRRIVQYVVESKLIVSLEERLAEIPRLEQQAASVAEEIVRLISFHYGEFKQLDEDNEETFQSHMAPVVKNALERLDGELEKLKEVVPTLRSAVDGHLRTVLDETNVYELTSASQELNQHLRRSTGRKAVSGARELVDKAVSEVQGAIVRLLYRRSEGVVLAQRLRADAGPRDTVVDRVLALVGKNTPRPDILSALPFYYRQLFAGQSTINEAFWVGRQTQLAQARKAIANYRQGSHGALVVIGQRGSGKTALCQVITARLLSKRSVFWVHPPTGGSTDVAAFKRALATGFSGSGSYADLFRSVPAGSTIVINDLDLWWERSVDGFAVIDELMELMARYGDRHFFVVNLGTHAFRYITRFRPLAAQALAVIECEAMAAESLEKIVLLRHGSTGMHFALGRRSEGQLTSWQRARLFSRHFDYANGNVGAALASWITHIDRIDDDTIQVRYPKRSDWTVLEDLGVDSAALLMQLILHKQLTMDRFTRLTGLHELQLRRELDVLRRMGLVQETRPRMFEVNRYVHHDVVERFTRKGVLP